MCFTGSDSACNLQGELLNTFRDLKIQDLPPKCTEVEGESKRKMEIFWTLRSLDKRHIDYKI